jgi:hypothetical protein
MDRMFLVEKGMFVVVRDGIKEVGFMNFQEFNTYYPSLDLSGKWYIDYEPERNLYIDSVLEINTFENLIPEYEQVINSIDDLISKKNDIYFNKNLEQTKIIRKAYIKNIFNTKINEGCLTSLGYRFDCDDSARANMVAAVMLLQLSSSTEINFIDYNNVSRLLTTQQMIQVGLEIGSHFQTLLYTKNSYYTQIDSQETVEDVKLVDWI